jgi:hypothetical protein
MLLAMTHARGKGIAVAAVLATALMSGCGGGDDGAKTDKPAASASQAPKVSVDDALIAYQAEAEGSCTDAPSCQDLMTHKLKAAKHLRVAMAAEDKTKYAEPVRMIRRAERLADHYGPEGMGAKGAYAAVQQPLEQATTWLTLNR